MKFIRSLNFKMIKEALSLTSTLKLRAFIMRYVNIIILISSPPLPL